VNVALHPRGIHWPFRNLNSEQSSFLLFDITAYSCRSIGNIYSLKMNFPLQREAINYRLDHGQDQNDWEQSTTRSSKQPSDELSVLAQTDPIKLDQIYPCLLSQENESV